MIYTRQIQLKHDCLRGTVSIPVTDPITNPNATDLYRDKETGLNFNHFATGVTVRNLTDGSSATISSIDDHDTLTTGTLTGGTNNEWRDGDTYFVDTTNIDLKMPTRYQILTAKISFQSVGGDAAWVGSTTAAADFGTVASPTGFFSLSNANLLAGQNRGENPNELGTFLYNTNWLGFYAVAFNSDIDTRKLRVTWTEDNSGATAYTLNSSAGSLTFSVTFEASPEN